MHIKHELHAIFTTRNETQSGAPCYQEIMKSFTVQSLGHFLGVNPIQ